jgi:hypothetical protein
MTAVRRYNDASLGHVTGSHYIVECWLATYAVWLLK